MVEKISIGEKICAIILRSGYKNIDVIDFFTCPEDTLQLGYMHRSKGHKITPHIHKPVARTVELTNEVLFIKSGKVKVTFYDDSRSASSHTVLSRGDVILLNQHGHGFEMLEDSEIIEVKQGPYVGEGDKIRFNM